MPPPYDLQLGDDDATRRWGGVVQAPAPDGGHVAAFKALLVATGLLEAVAPAGRFDAATRDAVLRFQWYVENVSGVIGPGGNFIAWTSNVCTIRNGVANIYVRDTLDDWHGRGWSVAGNLVRARFADYADIRAGAGFHELAGPGEFLVDLGFVTAMATAQTLATANGVTVFVNQTFRREGGVVSGAVVTPATSSAHKIGRAVDLNLAIGRGAPQPSGTMRSARPATPAGRFRDGMKGDGGCRYGGDFGTPDPPHFDRQLMPAGGFEWTCLFYFNQRQARLATTDVAAIPLAAP